LCIGKVAQAQTKIEKSIAAKPGQKLSLNFEDPKLIKLHTWDKNEIEVKGSVRINKGENDEAFQLDISQADNTVSITSILKDKENIPRRIVIKKGETEYYFKAKDNNDPAVQKFLDENGRDYTYMSHGIIKEIELEIFIPKGMDTHIESKFGLIEVTDFQAPLVANSKFGGIDASIVKNSTGELTARTQFGEILSNLDVKFDNNREAGNDKHWTIVSAKPGAGPRYDLESKFGKVYLRKP
jgi:hypothetical protein